MKLKRFRLEHLMASRNITSTFEHPSSQLHSSTFPSSKSKRRCFPPLIYRMRTKWVKYTTPLGRTTLNLFHYLPAISRFVLSTCAGIPRQTNYYTSGHVIDADEYVKRFHRLLSNAIRGGWDVFAGRCFWVRREKNENLASFVCQSELIELIFINELVIVVVLPTFIYFVEWSR